MMAEHIHANHKFQELREWKKPGCTMGTTKDDAHNAYYEPDLVIGVDADWKGNVPRVFVIPRKANRGLKSFTAMSRMSR